MKRTKKNNRGGLTNFGIHLAFACMHPDLVQLTTQRLFTSCWGVQRSADIRNCLPAGCVSLRARNLAGRSRRLAARSQEPPLSEPLGRSCRAEMRAYNEQLPCTQPLRTNKQRASAPYKDYLSNGRMKI